jgi:predicted nucleotidyltransferase component of viral defense system
MRPRSLVELLAEKTRAILTRSKGRDYFDFWYLLSKGIPLREDYIREKMKWYGKDYRQEDLTEIIAAAKEKTCITIWRDFYRSITVRPSRT